MKIYKNKTRQELIDRLVQHMIDNMDDTTLYSIIEYGHDGFASMSDEEIIYQYEEMIGTWGNDSPYSDDEEDEEE